MLGLMKCGILLLATWNSLGDPLSGTPLDLTRGDIPSDLPADIRELLEQTWSSDPEEREEAAAELGRMGRRAAPAVPFLLRLILVPDERCPEAWGALDDIDQPVVDPLVATLQNPDARIRERAASALESFADRRAVEPVIAALKKETDLAVRLWLLQVLQEHPDARSVDVLTAHLNDDAPEARGDAATALARIGDPRGVKQVLALLKDENAGVRGIAALVLGSTKDRRYVKPLLDLLNNSKEDEQVRDNPVRDYATIALGQLGDPQAFEPLMTELNSRKVWQQKPVIGALARLGDPRANKEAMAILRDKHRHVLDRVCVAIPFARSGDAEKIQAVVAESLDRSERRGFWKFALCALASSEDPKAYTHAITALKDPEPFVRFEAAYIFAENHRAIFPESADVRYPVMDDPRLVPELVALLEGKDGRILATMALGRTRNPLAVKPLIAALKHENAGVRLRAARALRDFEDMRAVEPLKALLNDEEDFVRAAAQEAIWNIQGLEETGKGGEE